MASLRSYLLVAAALMVLLVLTLVAFALPLGRFSLVVALAIAGAKAALVATYFMHLRHERGVTRLFGLAGLAWLAIMMALTLADYLTRQPPPVPVQAWPQLSGARVVEFSALPIPAPAPRPYPAVNS